MRPALLGEFWHECARCGRDYPESHLRKNDAGRWICDECWDENENEEG
ncbi:unnamed protein product [marine sediment metagenome]|uniref:Uncharacterized protein n=1 Tax=marine sediment metagenome TaxID=412755 RepID=X0RGV7_9ZZZZ